MLNKLMYKFSRILSYKKFIFIVLIAAIFIVAAVYVYRKTIKNSSALPKHDVQSDSHTESYDSKHTESSTNTNTNKSADLYLFYTEWCPHCKKTKPEWEQLKKSYQNEKINGYKLNFIEVDCEANQELANKFNITGYPTIKLIKGNQIIEFDAKPDVKTLEKFLSTVLAN